MFVHCAQTAEDMETISSAYDSPVSLPDRVKIWLTLVNLFLPKFAEKWLTCCWFKRRRHLVENCGRMIRDSAVVTIESIGNHHRSFEWYYRWPLWPPLLQNGGPPRPTSWRVLPPGEYDRRYRQDLFCVRHDEPSDVAFSQTTFGPCFICNLLFYGRVGRLKAVL